MTVNDKQMKRVFSQSLNNVVFTDSNTWEEEIAEPVGRYLFNGNADDSSSQNNDGILNTATLSSDTFGNENSAYCFSNRSDRIKVPLIPANTFSKGSFTVSLRVKINEDTTGMHSLVSNSNGRNPQWGLFYNFYNESSKFVFLIRDKEKQLKMIQHPITSGKWYKITSIRNAQENTLSLYIGSRHIKTLPGVRGDVNSGESIWIGEHTNQLFKGCIDDVVLWKKAFSAKEMKERNTIDTKLKNPVGNSKIIKKLNKGHKLPKY